jgi:hypothetical protein
MQDPTDQIEASIPATTTETESDGLNMSGMLRCKAARRTEPWYLESPSPPQLRRSARQIELQLQLPGHLALPPAQDVDIPARKKPRLETPIAIAMALPAADEDEDGNTDWATKANARWTPEEDADLTIAVANTIKHKYGGQYIRVDWSTIATLVAGRTKNQCLARWGKVLKPSIVRTAARAGSWTP